MASTWTAPRTWTVSETVTKVILDTHVRDNLSWLRDASAATYDTFTADVTVTATTEATADTVKASTAYTFDGATKAVVEIFTPQLNLGNRIATFVLLYDTTVLGQTIVDSTALANETWKAPVFLSFPSHTPASGSHTYTWKAFCNVSGGYTIEAGLGGTGLLLPGYIRVRLSAL